MTAETCIYHSVTLQAGEQFNLPPGATVVGVSNPDAITSENNCLDLTNLETLECYIVAFVSADCHDNVTHVGEPGAHAIDGLTVNGVWYPMGYQADCDGVFDVNAIRNFIDTNPVLNTIIFTSSVNATSAVNRGGHVSLCFKTYPSIAETMYFSHNWYLIGAGTPEPQEFDQMRPIKSSDYNRVDGCGCS